MGAMTEIKTDSHFKKKCEEICRWLDMVIDDNTKSNTSMNNTLWAGEMDDVFITFSKDLYVEIIPSKHRINIDLDFVLWIYDKLGGKVGGMNVASEAGCISINIDINVHACSKIKFPTRRKKK